MCLCENAAFFSVTDFRNLVTQVRWPLICLCWQSSWVKNIEKIATVAALSDIESLNVRYQMTQISKRHILMLVSNLSISYNDLYC